MHDNATAITKIVAVITSVVTVVFDVPPGVLMACLAGSFTAVAFRDDQISYPKAAGIIFGGASLAAIATPGFGEVFRLYAGHPEANINLLLKLIGLVLAFFPWHPPSRLWLVTTIKKWVGGEK